MANLVEINREIERIRARLHELVDSKKGNLIDKEVAALSTYLDQLIVKYEREKMK
jgi:hypothetical protein